MRGLKQEPQHALHIVGVSRACNDNVWHFVLAQTVGRGMADRAVISDPRKADHLFRKANGDFVSFLPDYAKRFVAAWAGHEVGKNAR